MMSRLEGAIRKLQKLYGPLPSPPSDPFAFFVWEILSGHSTPRKRDAAFRALTRQRVLTPDAMWTASPKMSLIQQFTDAGTWAIRIEPRSAGKIYSLRCRFRRRASQGGFPSVRHAKSFEDACEIVGAPAMAQYERSLDGPWVLAYLH